MEGEGVLSTSQAVLQHLPSLRRYARALTGSQGSGDAYVVATVESLIASPKILESASNSRVALYRLFTKIWNSVTVNGWSGLIFICAAMRDIRAGSIFA